MNQKYASTSLIEFELNGEAGIYFIQLLSAPQHSAARGLHQWASADPLDGAGKVEREAAVAIVSPRQEEVVHLKVRGKPDRPNFEDHQNIQT